MNHLRIVIVPLLLVAFGQGACLYLYWISGTAWEDTPRVLMTIMCGFALIISVVFSALYLQTQSEK